MTFAVGLVSYWSLFLTAMAWQLACAIFLLGTSSLVALLLIPLGYGRLGAVIGFILGIMYLARLFTVIDGGGYGLSGWPIVVPLE
jgi:hypothetical protein